MRPCQIQLFIIPILGVINIYSLYKITNLLNNKHYIGVTNRNPEERFAEHKKPSAKSFIGKVIQYGNMIKVEKVYRLSPMNVRE